MVEGRTYPVARETADVVPLQGSQAKVRPSKGTPSQAVAWQGCLVRRHDLTIRRDADAVRYKEDALRP